MQAPDAYRRSNPVSPFQIWPFCGIKTGWRDHQLQAFAATGTVVVALPLDASCYRQVGTALPSSRLLGITVVKWR